MKESLQAGLGSEALTSREALNYLEQLLLRRQEDVLYIAGINWQRLSRVLPALQAPVYRHVMGNRAEALSESVDDMILRILEMDKLEALAFIDGLVAEAFGKVLGLGSDRLDRNKSMFDLGMDSLMAMELSLGIEEKLRVDIPPMLLSQSNSISELVLRLYSHLSEGSSRDIQKEHFNMLAEKHHGGSNNPQTEMDADNVRKTA